MNKRIALMMPGQGSQFVGMAADLAAESPEVSRLYEEADEILQFPLSRLCWEGPEDELRRTENAQPAILLHSFAAWTSLPDEIRDSVVVAAGHSLGEFSAWLASGSLTLAQALRYSPSARGADGDFRRQLDRERWRLSSAWIPTS